MADVGYSLKYGGCITQFNNIKEMIEGTRSKGRSRTKYKREFKDMAKFMTGKNEENICC